MAVNKNSTAFTFTFAIVMVIVVGAILAFLSISLKPMQEANAADKKKMNILGAILVESTRQNASELFDQYVVERVSIDFDGKVVETRSEALKEKATDPKDPFYVDTKKDYKNSVKKVVNTYKEPAEFENQMRALNDVAYPVFKCQKNDTTFYVVPMVGTGLWGPIWGYVSVLDDYKTVYGATFDHKGETPGLGAEIKEAGFQNNFQGKSLNIASENNEYFVVQKPGGAPADYKVDGITGGTITSKGVEEMINRTMDIYLGYFNGSNNTSQLK